MLAVLPGLTAPTAEALAPQRPLPDDALRVVALGQKHDCGPDQVGEPVLL